MSEQVYLIEETIRRPAQQIVVNRIRSRRRNWNTNKQRAGAV